MKELKVEGNIGYSKEVELAVKSVKPKPMSIEDIGVRINPASSSLATFVKAEYAAIMYEVDATSEEAKAGTALGFPYTEEQLRKMCVTLIASRIGWVNGDMDLLVIRPSDSVCVPAMLAQSLKAIGLVEKLDCGKTYHPELEIPAEADGSIKSKKQWLEENTLDRATVMRMSQYLRRIENYVGASALPRDKQGSYDCCQVGIEGTRIVSWNAESHPANCLLVALPGIQYSVGEYYKACVTYGDLSYMGSILCGLTSIQL